MAVNTAQRADRDHRLYTWFAIFMPLIVLLGFARTYYLKAVFSGPALPSLLVPARRGDDFMGHPLLRAGLACCVPAYEGPSAPWAYRSLACAVDCDRWCIHRTVAAARDSSPGPPALQFLVVPLGDMVLFTIFVGTALYFRRRLHIHKRLMLLRRFPAYGSYRSHPLNFILTGGPLAFFGLTDLCLIGFVLFDTLKNRKLHPVFLWGGLVFIASQPLRLLLAGTHTWIQFATWLVAFVK